MESASEWMLKQVQHDARICRLFVNARHAELVSASTLPRESGRGFSRTIGFPAFGVSADTLMRMQTAYDLARARDHEAEIKVTRLEMAA